MKPDSAYCENDVLHCRLGPRQASTLSPGVHTTEFDCPELRRDLLCGVAVTSYLELLDAFNA